MKSLTLFALATLASMTAADMAVEEIDALEAKMMATMKAELAALRSKLSSRRLGEFDDLDTGDFSGVRVKRDDALVALGSKEDIRIVRTGKGEVLIQAENRIVLDSETVEVTGELGFAGKVLSGMDATESVKDVILGVLSNLTTGGHILCQDGWKGEMCLDDGRAPKVYCEENIMWIAPEEDEEYGLMHLEDVPIPQVVDTGPIMAKGNISVTYDKVLPDDLDYYTDKDDELATYKIPIGTIAQFGFKAIDDYANAAVCYQKVGVDLNECTSGDHECHEQAKCENIKGDEGSYKCTCIEGWRAEGSDGLECIRESCEVTIKAIGAGGGAGHPGGWSYGAEGAGGGYVEATVQLDPKKEYMVIIGEPGRWRQSNYWGWGGGAPNNRGGGDNRYGAGGGGGSGVWELGTAGQEYTPSPKNSQTGYADQFKKEAAVLIAGGGGGGGSSRAGTGNRGGGGGGTTGREGAHPYNGGASNTGHGGQTNKGGSGGSGQDGIHFTGGGAASGNGYGGGGGGGWYGGEGGVYQEPNGMTGGGGGSGYINSKYEPAGTKMVQGNDNRSPASGSPFGSKGTGGARNGGTGEAGQVSIQQKGKSVKQFTDYKGKFQCE